MKKLFTLGIALGFAFANAYAQSSWSWGYNLHGELGNNTWGTGYPTNVPGPVTSTSTDWRMLDANGNSILGIKSGGTLWGWGQNNDGQLATGDNLKQIVPVQIGADKDWSLISTGQYHVAGLKTDGTLWCWGNNTSGALGNGTSGGSEYLPKQVGTDKDWSVVAAGNRFTLAIKTNGTLWYWGNDYMTAPQENAPKQLGTSTDWKFIAVGIDNTVKVGIKTDGTMWAWGFNSYGQLGQGSAGANSTTPLKVGTDNNWVTASVGDNYSIALKSDGTLWSWGYNNKGQLGNGSTTDKYAPTQIGTDKDWKIASSGRLHCLAIKNDHSLWTWGWNLTGQLGNGSNTDVTSPAKIGLGADWEFAVGDEGYSVALRNIKTGIEETEQGISKITISPNPFTGRISIIGNTKEDSYELMNSFGQIIWQGKDVESQDFSSLHTGAYFLKINRADNIMTLKIIKQ